MPAEEAKAGPGPHVTSDMRDKAATGRRALWICVLKSRWPVRGAHATSDVRDIAATKVSAVHMPADEPKVRRLARSLGLPKEC
jgi:hypothetical protein